MDKRKIMDKEKSLSFSDMDNDKYIYIIAEIGINHNGSMECAKQLIDMAVKSGCDAVKFQKRDLEIVYGEEVLSQYRRVRGVHSKRTKRALEFSIEEYKEIDRYCKENNIEWFASSGIKKSTTNETV